MSLETYLARRLGRTATPETPAEIQGLQPRPAQTLAYTPATPETPKTATSAANDATDLHALLAMHGDASAGGVDWPAWAVSGASTSSSWLVLTQHGATLLRTAAPIPKPRSYSQAWPVERVAPWPNAGDDLDEEFQERAGILQFDAGLARADAEQMAVELIERARSCWGCRNLHAATSATNRLPRCTAGHRLVYRASLTRTWPGRKDFNSCGDRTDD